MKLKVTTYSGATYIVTDQRLVQGGSKNLKTGVLINPPVRLDKSLLIYSPERVPIRDMPPPAPGASPAVHSSYVTHIEEIVPLMVRILRFFRIGPKNDA